MSKTERLRKLEAGLLRVREKESAIPGGYRNLASMVRELGSHHEEDAKKLEAMATDHESHVEDLDEIVSAVRKLQKRS